MKPFGSHIKQKVFLAGKGKTHFDKKRDISPAPGAYNPSPVITKPKIPGFRINRKTKVNQYSSRSAWIDFSPTKGNPPCGQYEADRSIVITKPRTVGFVIKEPVRIMWTDYK